MAGNVWKKHELTVYSELDNHHERPLDSNNAERYCQNYSSLYAS